MFEERRKAEEVRQRLQFDRERAGKGGALSLSPEEILGDRGSKARRSDGSSVGRRRRHLELEGDDEEALEVPQYGRYEVRRRGRGVL